MSCCQSMQYQYSKYQDFRKTVVAIHKRGAVFADSPHSFTRSIAAAQKGRQVLRPPVEPELLRVWTTKIGPTPPRLCSELRWKKS
jgi:hypothetical protein